MTMNYTAAKIKKYYLQFNALTKYADKVNFFDEHFSIIPFSFPPFDVNLYSFFSDENFYRLNEILQYERKENPLIRNFYIGEELYKFSIRPFHNNAIILNKYIISRFLGTTKDFSAQLQTTIQALEAAAISPALQLEKATDTLSFLQSRFRQEYKLNFKNQFITVFVRGMADANKQEQPLLFSRKKKMIELYLYAMGFLFERYLQELKKNLNASAETSSLKSMPDALEKKMLLLHELGCIKAINHKYAFLNKTERDKKIAEVLSLITGDNWFKAQGMIET